MRALFLFASLMLAGCATEQKPPSLEPIVNRMFDRMMKLTRDDWTKQHITPAYAAASQALVQQAADEMRLYLAQPEGQQALKNEDVFQFSLMLGLWEIVDLLSLEYPEIRAKITSDTDVGRYAWAFASTGGFQSSQVCGDLHNNFGIYFFMGYYGTDPDQSPYKKIRQRLESIGLKPDPAGAKELWLKRCDPSQFDGSHGPEELIPGSRQRVANAPDTLEAILTELKSRMTSLGLPKVDAFKNCADYYGTC